jgi:hypothetical protein
MKRAHEDDEVVAPSPGRKLQQSPVQSISSLQEMVLHKIVSAFKSEDSLLFYMALISDEVVRELLRERWRIQQESPNQTLVVSRRKLLKADLVIQYLDRKETHRGILSQSVRTHTVPVVACQELMEYSLQKLQLKAVPSKAHRNPKFLLH